MYQSYKVTDEDGTEKEIHNGKLQVRIDKDIFRGTLFFVLTVRDPDTGKVYMLDPGAFTELKTEDQVKDVHARKGPSLSLDLEYSQALMDQLWRTGLRPSNSVSIGKGEAQDAHLADLRKSHDTLLKVSKRLSQTVIRLSRVFLLNEVMLTQIIEAGKDDGSGPQS